MGMVKVNVQLHSTPSFRRIERQKYSKVEGQMDEVEQKEERNMEKWTNDLNDVNLDLGWVRSCQVGQASKRPKKSWKP
jgi:(p)ppGpp synthase/HD superfamily hydrolase